MNRNATLWFIVAILVAAGIGTALLRHDATQLPWLPGENESIWLVEARVDFYATGGPVTASLSIPETAPGFSIFNEQAASAGYGFAIVTDANDRRGEWTRREASGAQSLYFSASFLPGNAKEDSKRGQLPIPAPEPVFWDAAQVTAATELIEAARSTSSNDYSFAREINERVATPTQNAALLLAKSDSPVDLMRKLLTDAALPTRDVMGLPLEDARRRQSLVPLLEFHDGEQWRLVDPGKGVIDTPENLLLWHRSGRSVLDVIGGQNSRLSFSIIRQSVAPVELLEARTKNSLFAQLGVHRLPIEEQSMFKLLLLLPLGATVVVFFRVLIGLQTTGTFMPVLIALVFLQTELVPGLISFVSVVLLGLLMRGYLSQLNLLLVARLAALIVLVIFVISALSVIGYQLGFSTGMVITFFPMIIIAWTIERLSILWEEEGPRDVLIQGSGTLMVAVVAYLLMDSTVIQHLSFNFPELNFVLLACILAMGQYTGYKLFELHRFAPLRNLGHK
ncbi:conserved hypothetical protein [Luminiphilus syltensis NOR5-1B]|uniref:Gonadoliberin III n=1 Tax=Luminiphilus syltensis NOR5-1B TaxID=565045 RepID=B8KVD2_9GAMM|nr:inactive transglutaminase family protein [Luminiphilus syltensis]EED36654.1 conserved hypothetical protein [Luminiphilus syltensis NOR5-1B]